MALLLKCCDFFTQKSQLLGKPTVSAERLPFITKVFTKKKLPIFQSRPSTPVYNLLGHKYQDLWLEERRKAEEATRARQEQKVFLKIILQ